MTLRRQRALTVEAFEQVRSLPSELRPTLEGLRMHADDLGRGPVEFRQILADVYPMDATVNEEVLTTHLLELAVREVILLYDHEGRSFYQFTIWPRVDRPSGPFAPAPPSFAWPSRDSRDSFAAGESGCESERESEGERESAREGEARSRMSREGLPPSPFCPEHADAPVTFPCIACQNARLANQHYKDRLRWELRQQHGEV